MVCRFAGGAARLGTRPAGSFFGDRETRMAGRFFWGRGVLSGCLLVGEGGKVFFLRWGALRASVGSPGGSIGAGNRGARTAAVIKESLSREGA